MAEQFTRPEPDEFMVMSWDGDLPDVGETLPLPALGTTVVFEVNDVRTTAAGHQHVRLVARMDLDPSSATWSAVSQPELDAEIELLLP